MTKDNKIIKDLKERNEKLVNQYRDRDIRCVSLERQLEKLQQENLKLRIQVSAREEVANKYKAVIDKADKWVRNYMDEWDIYDEVWHDLNDLLILLEEVE